ncbi:MAG: dihydroorotate dehydrogenase electron transfer subunit [Proteobacteria bacterium]|nr:dihydroorotate dehydrogenase electron transfer subunit [Pseudomonadota bacterium]
MSISLNAKVMSNQPVGPEIFLLTLEAPAIADAARPGQFVMLRVSPGPEPLLARPFSIHGVEGDKLLILYQVKGKGTKLLAQVRPGSELLVWGPLGSGFDLDVERPALVAGGMGMAPIGFVAKVLEERDVPFQVLSGGATKEAIEGLEKKLEALLRGRLEHGKVDRFRAFMAAKMQDALTPSTPPLSGTCTTTTLDGSYGQRGIVTDILQDSFSLPASARPDAVLACGPLPMLGAVAAMCDEQDVPCQVSLEAPMACGVGACLGCAIPAAGGGYLRACQEGPVMDASTVDWDKV